MGLDWCLSDKPKPGVDYAEFKAARDGGDETMEAYQALAVSPMETAGVPRIGIDQVATDYFLKEIVPSHREGIKARADNQAYVDHWTSSDEELVAKHHGNFVPELAEANKLSTIQSGMIAGAFSFRGKAVGYSELIGEELQNAAYGDMNPYEMSEYAKAIEDSAIESVKEQLKELGLPAADLISDALVAKNWVELTSTAKKERALADGFTFEDWAGYTKVDPATDKKIHFESHKAENLADELSVILDGARWLRFWADLGHSMWAWS